MATAKKSVKKPTVKKAAAKKPAAKKAVIKKEICKCGCASGGKCTCQDCKCENCNCGCKKDSVKYTNMFAAFRAFWRRGFCEWAGTSSRSEFWLAFLANILVYLAFGFMIICMAFLDVALFGENTAIFSTIVMSMLLLYVVGAIIPNISMLTRRMHDAGLSAWFWLLYLVSFVPWAGSYLWCVCVLIIALLPTQKVDNPYHKLNR